MIVTSIKDFAKKLQCLKDKVEKLKQNTNGLVYKELEKNIRELRDANMLFWKKQGVCSKTLAMSNSLTEGRISQILAEQKSEIITE